MTSLNTYLQIPIYILIFIVSLRLIIPLLSVLFYKILEKWDKESNIIGNLFEYLFEKLEPNSNVFKTILGLLIMIGGIYLLLNTYGFGDFIGSFLLVTGIQISLWAIGISSELLSNTNKVNHNENSDYDRVSMLSKKERENELFNKALGIWFSKNMDLIKRMSPAHLNELMYMTEFNSRHFQRHLYEISMNIRHSYQEADHEYKPDIMDKIEETNRLISDLNKLIVNQEKNKNG